MTKLLKKKAIYTQFRNFWNWESKTFYTRNGYEYKDHLNIIIDLSKPEDQLWKEVHSKRRNEIRRAKKEGVIFSVEDSEESLICCYKILLEVYNRAKLPLPDYSFFYNLFVMDSTSKLILFLCTL